MYIKNYPRGSGGKNDFNFFWSFGRYLFYVGTEKSVFVFIRPFFKNGIGLVWFFHCCFASLGFESLVFSGFGYGLFFFRILDSDFFGFGFSLVF